MQIIFEDKEYEPIFQTKISTSTLFLGLWSYANIGQLAIECMLCAAHSSDSLKRIGFLFSYDVYAMTGCKLYYLVQYIVFTHTSCLLLIDESYDNDQTKFLCHPLECTLLVHAKLVSS